jgi:hypothetical protein
MTRFLPALLALCLAAGSAKAGLSLNDDPVAYAIRPAVSARSEFAAIDFINTADESAKTTQAVRAIERLGVASKHAANYLYVQNDLLKEPQARLIAYRLALSREKQASNCFSLKAPSELGTELGLFFINSFAINMSEKNKRVAERRVEEQMKSQFNGYLEQRISFGIGIKNIGETEKEIAAIIDPAIHPAIGSDSIFASKSSRVRDAVESIIEEQESRAKASWKRLSPEQIYGLLIGTGSKEGRWTFLDGELRSLKADSVSFKGHCILTELTLELVGQTAGPRTIKIRAAFTVFKDGSISLIGTN